MAMGSQSRVCEVALNSSDSPKISPTGRLALPALDLAPRYSNFSDPEQKQKGGETLNSTATSYSSSQKTPEPQAA